MEQKLINKPTQCERILDALQSANGEWVNGRYFLQTMMLSQYHARLKEIEQKGYNIEHSDFKDEFGFISYRLLPKNTLF